MSTRVQPQPLLAVHDVEQSSAWYCAVLDATSGHGGPEYERVVVGDEFVLQLHRLEIGHHHGLFADPALPLGNGVAVWFAVDDLDAALSRARRTGAIVQKEIHHNPNAHHDELWLRDPDNYLVVLADRD
ncbi:glyoxalase/bleomycin resistance protein/dioxygenase superfamily protein [Kribbella amoyensis]|uniref:Glyoxalase/bleomycin resistance protein/dioxygenase superfamily protein n=1 Tax=Kribbella amoyensis TaxID=996641 RepID=A0A561BL71_9ACTN|nr:VOC family protein [Kribbella amoyensis]TWD79588.1 glyoxalase/bleomycin resistance protein/dioxygenase superfamily protein [Kribbella amoyensis]